MTGTIYIINQERNIGKIVFKDGRESKLMTFPSTFESGDIAIVGFVNNDPDEQLISLSAESPIVHYGSLLLPKIGEKPKPSVLVFYPLPLGLIYYEPQSIKFPVNYGNRVVSFRIRKDRRGLLKAYDIQTVESEFRYKCTRPSYGTIKSTNITAQEGYITAINDVSKSNTISHGIIDRFSTIKANRESVDIGYVKIVSEGHEAYFRIDLFQSFFKNKPVIGEEVFFSSKKGFYSSNIITQFHHSASKAELLSNQTIDVMLDKKIYRISMEHYMNVYKKSPQAGDIVWAYKVEDTIRLVRHADESRTSYRFIHDPDSRYKTPINVQEDKFIDFVRPEPEALYRAQIDKSGQLYSINKVNLSRLPEAIDVYKSLNKNSEAKLRAIDTMIKHKFQDKYTISTQSLITDRETLLKDMLAKLIAAGKYDQALQYEFRKQDFHYAPHELNKYKNLKVWAEAILDPINCIEPSKSKSCWDITPEPPSRELVVPSPAHPWNTDTDKTEAELEAICENNPWDIDLYDYSVEIDPSSLNINYYIDI